MNKKGLTLVELIAVIAILGILMVLVAPAVLEIRSMVTESSLDSKLSLIKTAAIEYGNKNIMSVPSITIDGYDAAAESCIAEKGATPSCRDYCLVVSVKTLIARGYLAGDNDSKDILLNPFNSEPLNTSDVCVMFDAKDALSRKLVAYVFDEENLYMGD